MLDNHLARTASRTAGAMPWQSGTVVQEVNTDTTWTLFEDLLAVQDVRYEERPHRAASPLVPLRAPQQPPACQEDLLDAVLTAARRNNRACPSDPQWEQLYRILGGADGASTLHEPLTGARGHQASPLDKRCCLRDQLTWATFHGRIAQAHAFLSALAEEDWIHL